MRRFVFVESSSGSNRTQLLRSRVRSNQWRSGMTAAPRGVRLAHGVVVSERCTELLCSFWRWWVVEAPTVANAWATLGETYEAAHVPRARHRFSFPMGNVLVSGGRDPRAKVRP